ncbi:MAG: DNA primase noncatalytic subunit PriX [Thaumarchaeota archaeon]|nr:DNA primase noncatalytic subunit PriX [Nitrososphaerota archaeon]
MSFRGATLSDLELRYPFAPRSRKFFEAIPVEEGLSSREVLNQTQGRLMSALGRKRYESHMSELIEFSSFFAAALVAGQDGYLNSKFSKSEAERARGFFVKEGKNEKATVMSECFGVVFSAVEGGDGEAEYSVPFEGYLALVSKNELSKSPVWKLSRQALGNGTVFLSDNLLNDLFAACAQATIAEGARKLRRAKFPRQLAGVRDSVLEFVPAPRPRTGKSYGYVDDLLKHPVTDGRHRLVWLVLAPYMVNVKNLENEEAVERIRGFVAFGGETREMKRFIEYNVRRARRNGLLPPTLPTLKAEHPDLYNLLPKEVLAVEAAQKPPR